MTSYTSPQADKFIDVLVPRPATRSSGPVLHAGSAAMFDSQSTSTSVVFDQISLCTSGDDQSTLFLVNSAAGRHKSSNEVVSSLNVEDATMAIETIHNMVCEMDGFAGHLGFGRFKIINQNYRTRVIAVFESYAAKTGSIAKCAVDCTAECCVSESDVGDNLEISSDESDTDEEGELISMDGVRSGDLARGDTISRGGVTGTIAFIKRRNERNDRATLTSNLERYNLKSHKVIRKAESVKPQAFIDKLHSDIAVMAAARNPPIPVPVGKIPREFYDFVISRLDSYYDYDRTDSAYQISRLAHIAQNVLGLKLRLYRRKAGSKKSDNQFEELISVDQIIHNEMIYVRVNDFVYVIGYDPNDPRTREATSKWVKRTLKTMLTREQWNKLVRFGNDYKPTSLTDWDNAMTSIVSKVGRGYAPEIDARRNHSATQSSNGNAAAIAATINNAQHNVRMMEESPELATFMQTQDPDVGNAANYPLPSAAPVPESTAITDMSRHTLALEQHSVAIVKAATINADASDLASQRAADATRYQVDVTAASHAEEMRLRGLRDAEELRLRGLRDAEELRILAIRTTAEVRYNNDTLLVRAREAAATVQVANLNLDTANVNLATAKAQSESRNKRRQSEDDGTWPKKCDQCDVNLLNSWCRGQHTSSKRKLCTGRYPPPATTATVPEDDAQSEQLTDVDQIEDQS